MAGLLIDLAGLLFVTQQVKEPTRKLNILDLFFVLMILLTILPLQTHFCLTIELLMLVFLYQFPDHTSPNPSSNVFEKIDFDRSDWPQLAKSLNNIDWEHELYELPPEMHLPFATNIIDEKCMLLLFFNGQNKGISMFHRKRIILMRKRRKLVKSYKSHCDKNAQILHSEELICDSHTQEKLHDEESAVTKIKTDPNYFFRYAKKHSICLNEIRPLMDPNKALTFDKYEMCCSLLYQFNSVFTKPHPEEIVTNPSSFCHATIHVHHY